MNTLYAILKAQLSDMPYYEIGGKGALAQLT